MKRLSILIILVSIYYLTILSQNVDSIENVINDLIQSKKELELKIDSVNKLINKNKQELHQMKFISSGGGIWVTTSGEINYYDVPDLIKHTELGTIPKNTRILIIEQTDVYYKTYYGNEVVYISKSLVRLDDKDMIGILEQDWQIRKKEMREQERIVEEQKRKEELERKLAEQRAFQIKMIE